jgi:hypothetical protein
MFIMFRLLGVSEGADRAVGGVRWPEIHQLSQAFDSIADQIFPAHLLTAQFATGVVLISVIFVPIGVAIGFPIGRKPALFISIGYSISYCTFLVLAQIVANPPPIIDLRLLLQIFPFLLISLACAIDTLSAGKRSSRALALAMLVLLAVAAARSVRANIIHLYTDEYTDESVSGQHCISREDISTAIKKTEIAAVTSRIITNVQGLVWYVLRIPTDPLTSQTLQDAPQGSVILYVKENQLCSNVEESNEIDEKELIAAPQIRILSINDLMLTAQKMPAP